MNISSAIEKDCTVITLSGRLDTLTAPHAQEKIEALVKTGSLKLILNLQNVDYISSAGLRVLLIAQKKVTPEGGSVVLFGVSEELIHLFEVSGFSQLFCFTATLDESFQFFDQN
jgi:anti-sigma B factor antagonist